MSGEASPRAVAERAAVLRRLDLLVSRRLDGLVSGEFLGIGTGPGSEPAGVRPYGPGDEARRIDWNVTARSLAPQVRTTDPDRELETWIVVDSSASLDFGTTVQEKRDVALAATAAFGLLSLQGGNRVQFLVAGHDELQRLKPASSRLSIMAALARLHDGERAQRPPAPGAALHDALETLARVRRRRGRVVVVSDFLDDGWTQPLQAIAHHHQTIAVQVVDPRERELPPVGILALVDTESGREIQVQTNSAKLRARYADAARARHEAIATAVHAAGASHLVLGTDRDWVADISMFVRRQNQHRFAQRAAVTVGVAG